MQVQAARFRGHIAEFDAFRAFGVLMVMLTHTWPGKDSFIWPGLQLSWILMDGFFVISGYLIAGILLDGLSKSGFLRTFYTRRALRILPVYYLIVITLTVFGTLSRTPGYRDMLNDWGSPFWFWAYLGNIPTALSGHFPLGLGDSFVPLWSLQVEEQFYLIFPLLVYQLRLKTLKRVLWVLAGVSVITRIVIFILYPNNLYAQYVLLPCRMEGLAFGALIAIRLREGPWEICKTRLNCLTFSWLTVAIICAGVTGFGHQTSFNRTLGYLVSSIAASRVVLWFIWNRDTRLTEALRWKPVQYVGKISYGAYLLHEPIEWLLDSACRRLGLTWFQEYPVLVVPAVIGMTLIAASLSWHYLESPVLNLKDRRLPRRDERELLAA